MGITDLICSNNVTSTTTELVGMRNNSSIFINNNC